ncbi:MAG TPA: hypothetical protein VM425_10885 [Myxococcota bacterium]|nr:hypothetical protein [Myxococcota bacterium]
MIGFSAKLSTVATLVACLTWPLTGSAQDAPAEKQPATYKAPSRADWSAAGLELEEYNTALRYEVTLDEWKEMDRSRHNRRTAGWACIGVALLAPAIEATIIWGGGVDYMHHPEAEVFIVVNVAALATLVTGIVLAATAPGPEDFKRRWQRQQDLTALHLVPSPGGLGLGFSF